MTEKYSRWVFTCWEKPKIALIKSITFMTWQKEICPTTKRIHYQGYIEFSKDYGLSYIKALFKEKGMFLEKAKYSDEVNYRYCSKDRTKAEDQENFVYGKTIETSITWDDLLQ